MKTELPLYIIVCLAFGLAGCASRRHIQIPRDRVDLCVDYNCGDETKGSYLPTPTGEPCGTTGRFAPSYVRNVLKRHGMFGKFGRHWTT